jgi:hypothetical protein
LTQRASSLMCYEERWQRWRVSEPATSNGVVDLVTGRQYQAFWPWQPEAVGSGIGGLDAAISFVDDFGDFYVTFVINSRE